MPPKQDVFADLFAGSRRKNNETSMSMQQRLQRGALATPLTPTLLLLLLTSLAAKLDPFDILAIDSRNSTSNQPGNVAKSQFSAGGANSSNQKVQSGSSTSTNDLLDEFFGTTSVANVPSAPKSSNTSNAGTTTGLLLDDDFTDAFVAEPAALPSVESKSHLARDPKPSKSHGSQRNTEVRDRESSLDPRRDAVVAKLVDIGFDVDTANDAIDRKGCDLQSCVNYIMAKAAGDVEQESVLPQRPQRGQGPDLEQWLNKGMLMGFSLFNKANKTIMKNIDQFVDGGRPDQDGMPAWMKQSLKYKDHAIEKKYNVEDYGSDLENIDEAEIQRIIREQKQRREQRRDDRSSEDLPKQTYPEKPSRRVNENRPTQSRPALTDALPRRPVQLKPTSSDVLPSRPKGKPEKLVSSDDDLPKRPSPKPKPAPATPAPQSVDLLGLLSSNAPSSSLRSNVPLNTFDETDYSTAKEAATAAYVSGDYTTALEQFQISLARLPANHERRVIIGSNLANAYKMVGNLKQSLQATEDALKLIDAEGEVYTTSNNVIAEKPIKYWYTKLVLTQAEVNELMERYENALDLYTILVSKLGVSDRKVTDGRRRVDKVVNPENYRPKPKPATTTAVPSKPKTKSSSPPVKLKPQEDQAELLDEIETGLDAWAQRKQNNLRGLLSNLDEVIPLQVSMNPQLRKLTLNDLMLPKQVKIQYMKVISAIHPDKLALQCKENPRAGLVCNAVFIRLNKAWEQFKIDENIS